MIIQLLLLTKQCRFPRSSRHFNDANTNPTVALSKYCFVYLGHLLFFTKCKFKTTVRIRKQTPFIKHPR